MKSRLTTVSSMVCALIFLSGVLAVGQSHQALYAPHAVGVTPPPVRTGTPALRESPASTATWTKAKNTRRSSVVSSVLLTATSVLVHSSSFCSG